MKHLIKIESTSHGVLGVRHTGLDQQYCEAGEQVILKWQPDAKWGLQEAHYTDKEGNIVPIDLGNGKGVVAFMMPDKDITLGGTFKMFVSQDWTEGTNPSKGEVLTVGNNGEPTPISVDELANQITEGDNDLVDAIDRINPFKGWYTDIASLQNNHPSPQIGDYAYVKGAESTDPAAIYECTTAGSWSDSGRTADTSNVQTFATGEEVNEVHIVDDLITGGSDDVLSAEQGKNLVDGFQLQTFDYSQFSEETPNILFSSSSDYLTMEQVGDYLEIDVNPNGPNGSIVVKTASYNNPLIKFSAEKTLQVRFSIGNDGIFTKTFTDNTTWNQRHIIKCVLTSHTSNDYVVDVYLDGTKVLADCSFTTPTGLYYDKIGNGTTMKLYSIKGKRNGVDYELTRFSEISGAVGITDVYDTTDYKGLLELNQDMEELSESVSDVASKVTTLLGEDMYYAYYSNGSTYFNCNKYFRIYQRLKDNIYLRFAVGYYGGGVTNAFPKHYWRIVGCNLVTLENGVETVIEQEDMSDKGYSILTAGESEFVLQWTAGEAYNFSGGYSGGFHFGETIDDTGCYVEFVADGNVLDLTQDIPLTSCKTFLYKEYSNIYQNNDSPASIAANHYKETVFKDCGYTTENNVKFVQALDYFAYNGIVCVNRWLSQYAMPENAKTITDMGTGTPTQASQFSSYNHKIHYEGHGYACDVESHINFGADDSECTLVVYNDTAYNKYYRRNPTTEGNVNNRIGGITSVKIYSL